MHLLIDIIVDIIVFDEQSERYSLLKMVPSGGEDELQFDVLSGYPIIRLSYVTPYVAENVLAEKLKIYLFKSFRP